MATEKEKKDDSLTPTEVSNLITAHIMAKPNKSITFKSFVNAIKDKQSFITYCLKEVKDIDTKFLEEVIDIASGRINEIKDEEIKNLELEIKLKQERLAELKKK